MNEDWRTTITRYIERFGHRPPNITSIRLNDSNNGLILAAMQSALDTGVEPTEDEWGEINKKTFPELFETTPDGFPKFLT